MDLKALREIDYSDIPMGYKVIIMGLIDYATELEKVLGQRNAECDRLIMEKGMMRIDAVPVSSKEEKHVICKCEQFFDEHFDGTLCKVSEVVQIYSTKKEAEEAFEIFDPARYDDWNTVMRIVPVSKLGETFR